MLKQIVSILALSLVITQVSCKKENSAPSKALEASKTNLIRKGEPILFTLSQASASSSVNWRVNPAANAIINSSGNQAAIRFTQKGTYIVTATAGDILASRTVDVTDTSYVPDPNTAPPLVHPFSSGETINIHVSKTDSIGLTALTLSGSTTNSYPCMGSWLISGQIPGSNGYSIEFTGVAIPQGCNNGNIQVSDFGNAIRVTEGEHALQIEFNGATYSGHITKNGAQIIVDWPYQTGVLISPTTL